MEAIKLTTDWNAEPNAPEVALVVRGRNVILDFFVNYFLYHQFKEDDKAKLTFYNCHKYFYGSPNDEGYYLGQHRYKYTELPYGQFYQLKTDWEIDFPKDCIILSPVIDASKLHHYIFFFREATFECVAENYSVAFYGLFPMSIHPITLV